MYLVKPFDFAQCTGCFRTLLIIQIVSGLMQTKILTGLTNISWVGACQHHVTYEVNNMEYLVSMKQKPCRYMFQSLNLYFLRVMFVFFPPKTLYVACSMCCGMCVVLLRVAA